MGRVRWTDAGSAPIPNLPQICWEDGSSWGEANVWAVQQASSRKTHIDTVARSMSHLTAYARWLESEGMDWWQFPEREDDRCLVKFRGALVALRDAGELAPSTTSQRMAAVVRFYRWLQRKKLLSSDLLLWQERQIGVRLADKFGFEHTLRITSTDLSIPNSKVSGALPLEDGLMPVSISAMNQILDLAYEKSSEELYLMLLLGFRSGLRIGTILDLKIQTIAAAAVDPAVGWHQISLGPGARPPVATKFGVSGVVPVMNDVLDKLRNYINSTRRLKRQSLASGPDRDLLFLNRFGKPYTAQGSRAINVSMSRLRDVGTTSGAIAVEGFHFHRSRATFATELMRAALKCMPVSDAIAMVREACLHRDEATTLRYVKFVERTEAMANAADAFTEAFLGRLVEGRKLDV